MNFAIAHIIRNAGIAGRVAALAGFLLSATGEMYAQAASASASAAASAAAIAAEDAAGADAAPAAPEPRPTIATVHRLQRYRDASLPTSVRVADLLRRMTLEEKCDQLRQMELSRLQIFEGAVSEESLGRIFRERAPGIVRMEAGRDILTTAIRARDTQNYFLKKSRLGIPPLMIIGGTSGVEASGATIFPSTLALGATWNPKLVREMGKRVATEASTLGATNLLAPSFALGRDPRFGGISQCFGECPTLVTEMALAFLEGLQGREPIAGQTGETAEAAATMPAAVNAQAPATADGNPAASAGATDAAAIWLAPNKVFGTALHFTGWGASDGGLYGAPVSLSTRSLRALHFPPFEDAVKIGGAQAVMPVISPVNSVPGHANGWLLDTVLRGEWQFPGVVFSAPDAVAMNSSIYAVSRGTDGAAAQALAAGVDVETGGDSYKALAAAVRAKKISEAEIDRAAARVLRMKFAAGLFDARRSVNPELLPVRIHTDDSRDLSRRLAAESVILLKNMDDFLPLDTSRVKSLAVIGPNADRSQFGDGSWRQNDSDGVTILQGLRNLLGNKVRIHHARGCEIAGTSRIGFPEAVAVAKRCDAVLVVLGDESAPSSDALRSGLFPHTPTSGAGYDVTNPVLPGVQEDLVREIAATGRPVVVVFLHGRPYSTPWIKENATAIISMFFAGEEQGNALADVLFGNLDPGGRLPVSVARGAGSLPTNYDFTPGSRGIYGRSGSQDFPGRNYVFSEPGPLWPFGFGLSYARFHYSDLNIKTPTISGRDKVQLSFSVSNLSTRDGTDVAQIYFRNTTSLVSGPLLRLVSFEKFQVKAGANQRVSVEFKASAMSEWDRLVRSRVTLPGEYEILIGTNAEDIVLRGKVVVEK